MWSPFAKKMKPGAYFERAMTIVLEDESYRIALLQTAMPRCKGKYRDIGREIIKEILKRSGDPVQDLRHLLWDVKDAELAVNVVDLIAARGLENDDVMQALEITISDSMCHRAARERANVHYGILSLMRQQIT